METKIHDGPRIVKDPKLGSMIEKTTCPNQFYCIFQRRELG
jgi:hypothetical protein